MRIDHSNDQDEVFAEHYLRDQRSRDQIRDALRRYCRGVDRRDWNLVRSAYHADAHDVHGTFSGGVNDFINWVMDRHSNIAQSMHFLGNCSIELNGVSARTETYCVAYQRLKLSQASAEIGTDNGPIPEIAIDKHGHVQTQVRCRYLDEFECRAGDWRIVNRRVVYESRQYEVALALGPNVLLATRDGSDPIYTGWTDNGER